MFGRRPDATTPATMPPATQDDKEIDLDLLPDLTAVTGTKPPPTQPIADSTDFDEDGEWTTTTAPRSVAAPRPMPEPTPFVPSVPATSNTASTPRPATGMGRSSESVIGPDDFFDGNYRSERGVRIQGSVRGSIESRQYIYVEASAQVDASLSAEDITIAGTYNGKIECRHRLEIASTGRIKGTVTTALLVVQEGGMLDGDLHMNGDSSR